MLTVQYASFEVDADPILEEAFAALPFIKPAYHDLFRGIFQQHWNTGDLERIMRESGLPADFFSDLGSRRTPKDALRAIELRAFHNITRAGRAMQVANLLSDPVSQKRWRTVRCVCEGHNTCRSAKKLHGKIVPVAERIEFPLVSCTSEWCACSCEPVYERRSG